MALVGIIGGSGLYQMDGLTELREVRIETPFGPPSDSFLLGSLNGVELAFLPRHGKEHHLTPTEVPYRANIWALKKLGVEWIVSASAVGSLQAEIVPGHMVVIDQFIDRTKDRVSTFFGDGVVAHVAFGDPVCSTLRGFILEAAESAGAVVHDGGVYVCMEGPAFSTRAESNLYRSWGASVIGMTNLPEAKLAREAEISYATLAMATDYDCWHQGHDDVTVEQVVAVLTANATLARKIIRNVIPHIQAHDGPAPQNAALANALLSRGDTIPAHRKEQLKPIIGKYLK